MVKSSQKDKKKLPSSLVSQEIHSPTVFPCLDLIEVTLFDSRRSSQWWQALGSLRLDLIEAHGSLYLLIHNNVTHITQILSSLKNF